MHLLCVAPGNASSPIDYHLSIYHYYTKRSKQAPCSCITLLVVWCIVWYWVPLSGCRTVNINHSGYCNDILNLAIHRIIMLYCCFMLYCVVTAMWVHSFFNSLRWYFDDSGSFWRLVNTSDIVFLTRLVTSGMACIGMTTTSKRPPQTINQEP